MVFCYRLCYKKEKTEDGVFLAGGTDTHRCFICPASLHRLGRLQGGKTAAELCWFSSFILQL